jgi:hypothetical protein
MKKVTLVFPSSKEMWDFFSMTGLKEFRLDSAKCSITGRFSESEIELAQSRLNATLYHPESD